MLGTFGVVGRKKSHYYLLRQVALKIYILFCTTSTTVFSITTTSVGKSDKQKVKILFPRMRNMLRILNVNLTRNLKLCQLL